MTIPKNLLMKKKFFQKYIGMDDTLSYYSTDDVNWFFDGVYNQGLTTARNNNFVNENYWTNLHRLVDNTNYDMYIYRYSNTDTNYSTFETGPDYISWNWIYASYVRDYYSYYRVPSNGVGNSSRNASSTTEIVANITDLLPVYSITYPTALLFNSGQGILYGAVGINKTTGYYNIYGFGTNSYKDIGSEAATINQKITYGIVDNVEDNTISIYENGILKATDSVTANYHFYGSTTYSPYFYILSGITASGDYPYSCCNHKFYAARSYSRILTADELKKHASLDQIRYKYSE